MNSRLASMGKHHMEFEVFPGIWVLVIVEYSILIEHVFMKQARAILMNKLPTQEEGATELEAPGDADAKATTLVCFEPFLSLVTMPSGNSSILYRVQYLASCSLFVCIRYLTFGNSILCSERRKWMIMIRWFLGFYQYQDRGSLGVRDS